MNTNILIGDETMTKPKKSSEKWFNQMKAVSKEKMQPHGLRERY